MKPRTAPEDASLPAVHALHLVQLVARWRVPADALLDDFGLTESGLSDPEARLSIATCERIIARARALTGEPALGIYLGLQMRVAWHGYLGFAAMTAATARDALLLAMRYAPTRTSAIGLRLHESGRMASLVIEERASLGTAQDAVIFALLVGIWQIGGALTGRALEGSADVTFAEPAYFGRFPDVARVRFEQPVHQLVFDRALLDLPLAMADPAAQRLVREQCERALEALGTGARLSVRVRQRLPREGGGFRTLDEVAAELGTSPRTLKRKLAQEGHAFSSLLDEERRERALLLLRAPELSLEDVADRLGYSDLANFSRAFRRWTGRTPGAFRRRSG